MVHTFSCHQQQEAEQAASFVLRPRRLHGTDPQKDSELQKLWRGPGTVTPPSAILRALRPPSGQFWESPGLVSKLKRGQKAKTWKREVRRPA